jgi:hypothetical protein
MAPPFRAGTTVEEEGPALSKRDVAARARRLRGFLRELEDSPPVDRRWTTATNMMWLWRHGDRTAKWAYCTDEFLREAWPKEFAKENK